MTKTIIQKYLIGLLLLAVAVTFSYVYIRKLDPSISVLLKEHSGTEINGVDMLKGVIIRQKINADYDNLGIVSVRFQTFGRINDDVLIFRIKESGKNEWYYSAKYKVDQFQDREFFPFGFPIIANSSGKSYEFEIESLLGTWDDHVSVDVLKPIVLTKYHYAIRQFNILSKPLYSFFILKIGNLFSNYALLFPVAFYFIPFIYFIFHYLISKEKVTGRYLLFIYPIFMYLIQVTASLSPPRYWEIIISIFWIMYLMLNRLDYKINFIIALGLFPLMLQQLIEGYQKESEIAAYWMFIFLIFGVLHVFLKSFIKPKAFVSANEYFTSIMVTIKSIAGNK